MQIARYLNHIKYLKNTGKLGRLTIEIAMILATKLLLLWLIWVVFFSHPIPKDARQDAVTRVILSNSH